MHTSRHCTVLGCPANFCERHQVHLLNLSYRATIAACDRALAVVVLWATWRGALDSSTRRFAQRSGYINSPLRHMYAPLPHVSEAP
jgi:hypothetical protein